MTELLQIYKCDLCGNMTEVIHTGKGQMSCCAKPMTLMCEGVTDAALE